MASYFAIARRPESHVVDVFLIHKPNAPSTRGQVSLPVVTIKSSTTLKENWTDALAVMRSSNDLLASGQWRAEDFLK